MQWDREEEVKDMSEVTVKVKEEKEWTQRTREEKEIIIGISGII